MPILKTGATGYPLRDTPEYSVPVLLDESNLDPFTLARQNMVETQLRARGIRDERLLNAMARFRVTNSWSRDIAIRHTKIIRCPSAPGQTVSQPYIVALMLELLQLEPSSKVLEIGTGSGYQTALLAKLAAHVYSVERHPQLAHAGGRRRCPGSASPM